MNDAINEPGSLIVDVRNADELERDGNFGAMGVENWVHIPRNDIESAVKLSDADFQAKYSCNKFTNDLKIVVHCKSGTETGRSAQAADILKGAGYNAVFAPGGILGWKEKFSASTLPSGDLDPVMVGFGPPQE